MTTTDVRRRAADPALHARGRGSRSRRRRPAARRSATSSSAPRRRWSTSTATRSAGRRARAPSACRRSSASEWGGRLIRGWDESWMAAALRDRRRRSDARRSARRAGQTVIGDSTTVLLYKLIRAAFDAQHAADADRVEIVVDRDNFPTDRYLVEGIAARARRPRPLDRRRPRVGRDRRRPARSGRAADRGRRAEPRRLPVRLPRGCRRRSPASRTTPARSSCGTSATRPARCRSRRMPGTSTSRSAARTSTSTAAPARPAFAYVAARHQAAARAADPGLDGHRRRLRDGSRVRARRGHAPVPVGHPADRRDARDAGHPRDDRGCRHRRDPRRSRSRSPSSPCGSPTTCSRRSA